MRTRALPGLRRICSELASIRQNIQAPTQRRLRLLHSRSSMRRCRISFRRRPSFRSNPPSVWRRSARQSVRQISRARNGNGVNVACSTSSKPRQRPWKPRKGRRTCWRGCLERRPSTGRKQRSTSSSCVASRRSGSKERTSSWRMRSEPLLNRKRPGTRWPRKRGKSEPSNSGFAPISLIPKQWWRKLLRKTRGKLRPARPTAWKRRGRSGSPATACLLRSLTPRLPHRQLRLPVLRSWLAACGRR
mmetsp:Transcript_66666/g.156957  ORF Transcript_66666/g.156957 Transcript_66666/m.156957 type:complete len:246 (-) Transcript_66666:1720-2457(-)